MPYLSLILQGATLVVLVYGVRLLYDCLSSLDLIAYGEDEETETEVTILDRGTIDLEVTDAGPFPEDEDLGEGFYDVLDEEVGR